MYVKIWAKQFSDKFNKISSNLYNYLTTDRFPNILDTIRRMFESTYFYELNSQFLNLKK